jgi:hypothetical protein
MPRVASETRIARCLLSFWADFYDLALLAYSAWYSTNIRYYFYLVRIAYVDCHGSASAGSPASPPAFCVMAPTSQQERDLLQRYLLGVGMLFPCTLSPLHPEILLQRLVLLSALACDASDSAGLKVEMGVGTNKPSDGLFRRPRSNELGRSFRAFLGGVAAALDEHCLKVMEEAVQVASWLKTVYNTSGIGSPPAIPFHVDILFPLLRAAAPFEILQQVFGSIVTIAERIAAPGQLLPQPKEKGDPFESPGVIFSPTLLAVPKEPPR